LNGGFLEWHLLTYEQVQCLAKIAWKLTHFALHFSQDPGRYGRPALLLVFLSCIPFSIKALLIQRSSDTSKRSVSIAKYPFGNSKQRVSIRSNRTSRFT
jgi:hypothetical protein